MFLVFSSNTIPLYKTIYLKSKTPFNPEYSRKNVCQFLTSAKTIDLDITSFVESYSVPKGTEEN